MRDDPGHWPVRTCWRRTGQCGGLSEDWVVGRIGRAAGWAETRAGPEMPRPSPPRRAPANAGWMIFSVGCGQRRFLAGMVMPPLTREYFEAAPACLFARPEIVFVVARLPSWRLLAGSAIGDCMSGSGPWRRRGLFRHRRQLRTRGRYDADAARMCPLLRWRQRRRVRGLRLLIWRRLIGPRRSGNLERSRRAALDRRREFARWEPREALAGLTPFLGRRCLLAGSIGWRAQGIGVRASSLPWRRWRTAKQVGCSLCGACGIFGLHSSLLCCGYAVFRRRESDRLRKA
jgi:hypothetical protein